SSDLSLRMGEALRRLAMLPDLILCSTARRAAETLEHLLPGFQGHRPQIEMRDELYGTDAAHYLRIVHAAPEVPRLMVIGHNPMTEDLALELAGAGDREARARMERGFPTCGLAVLSFPDGAVYPGGGTLEHFLTPRGLESEADPNEKASDPWQG